MVQRGCRPRRPAGDEHHDGAENEDGDPVEGTWPTPWRAATREAAACSCGDRRRETCGAPRKATTASADRPSTPGIILSTSCPAAAPPGRPPGRVSRKPLDDLPTRPPSATAQGLSITPFGIRRDR